MKESWHPFCNGKKKSADFRHTLSGSPQANHNMRNPRYTACLNCGFLPALVEVVIRELLSKMFQMSRVRTADTECKDKHFFRKHRPNVKKSAKKTDSPEELSDNN